MLEEVLLNNKDLSQVEVTQIKDSLHNEANTDVTNINNSDIHCINADIGSFSSCSREICNPISLYC